MISAVISFFVGIFTKLFKVFVDIVAWFLDLILLIPRVIYQAVVDYILVPVLQFIWDFVNLDAISSALSSIPPEAGYILSIMAVGQGLTIIVGAYLVRFIIRRIPLVG